MPAPGPAPWQRTLYEVIFETRTRAGFWFDVALIGAIVLSVAVVMVESVPGVREDHWLLLYRVEWGFTLLFTVEYVVRLSVVDRARRYATSFFGVVDLLAILPTYLSLLVPGAQALLVIRLLRILRIFHIFHFTRAEGASNVLLAAFRTARHPIGVFLAALATIVAFLGTVMYLVEGEDSGFTSIPTGVYWAVVTLTTLGYGDLVPLTPLGRTLTTGIVILGYGALAVPVGIMSIAIADAARRRRDEVDEAGPSCPGCGLEDHEADARYCRWCGERLQEA